MVIRYSRFSYNPTAQEIEQNYDYYHGNHWDYWIGPRIPQSEPRAAELMQEVERVFQSINLIKECIDRHVNGLIAQFPMWYLKAVDGDRLDTSTDTRAAEAEQTLQRWLDKVLQRVDSGETDQQDPFLQSVTDLAIAGDGALRLWQPRKYAESEDVLDRYHLHAVRPGILQVNRDIEGFVYKLSYSYGTGSETEEMLPDGSVTISSPAREQPLVVDTGGRWTYGLMRSPCLITPQIKQSQNAINHALTMLMRNQEQGGFLEKIFLNAQPPGEWIEDPTAPGGYRFVPSSEGLHHGAGQDIFLTGLTQGDPANPSYSNPSVVFREPVSPETFLSAIAGYRTFIYHAFGQGHLLTEGDGGISGVSRIQLRQDFEITLLRQKRTIESAIANVLNVMLRILDYPEYEAVVKLRTTTGKLSPEERTAVIQEYDKGLLSKATAIAILGTVDDVDAELALIEEEKAANMPVIADPFGLGDRDPEPNDQEEDPEEAEEADENADPDN